MKTKKRKSTVEIKTRTETKPIIYVDFLHSRVIETTIKYERPYLEITIPFK